MIRFLRSRLQGIDIFLRIDVQCKNYDVGLVWWCQCYWACAPMFMFWMLCCTYVGACVMAVIVMFFVCVPVYLVAVVNAKQHLWSDETSDFVMDVWLGSFSEITGASLWLHQGHELCLTVVWWLKGCCAICDRMCKIHCVWGVHCEYLMYLAVTQSLHRKIAMTVRPQTGSRPFRCRNRRVHSQASKLVIVTAARFRGNSRHGTLS